MGKDEYSLAFLQMEYLAVKYDAAGLAEAYDQGETMVDPWFGLQLSFAEKEQYFLGQACQRP